MTMCVFRGAGGVGGLYSTHMTPANVQGTPSYLRRIYSTVYTLPVGKRKPVDGDLPQRVDGDGSEWSVHLVESQWLPSVFSTSISTPPGAASRSNFFPSSRTPNPSLNGIAECGCCLR